MGKKKTILEVPSQPRTSTAEAVATPTPSATQPVPEVKKTEELASTGVAPPKPAEATSSEERLRDFEAALERRNDEAASLRKKVEGLLGLLAASQLATREWLAKHDALKKRNDVLEAAAKKAYTDYMAGAYNNSTKEVLREALK